MPLADPTDPVDRLLEALVRSTFDVTAVLTRVAAAHDLSLTQLRVLGILRDRRVGVTALASYLGLDKSTLSGLVDRAERRGLVRRERSPLDRRAVDVLLTPEGRALLARLDDAVRRSLAPRVSTLPPPERARLADLLESMQQVE